MIDYAPLPNSYSKFKWIEIFELYNPLTNIYHLTFSDYDSSLN
ncbi:MAG: hypothetical protein PHC62_09960 [Candidatus Izemoplasmatales bacterium]|nr:hypothetical protein [Candidatus Izemoplasmatales bacterium]